MFCFRHEVINVNIWDKPAWFADKNPKQLVPILEQDDKIVYESLIVSTYIEAIFPDKNPLMPKDPYLRAKDEMLLDFHGGKVSVLSVFKIMNCLCSKSHLTKMNLYNCNF